MSIDNAYGAVVTFFLTESLRYAENEISLREFKRRVQAFRKEKEKAYGRKSFRRAYRLFKRVNAIESTLTIINAYLGERYFNAAELWIGFLCTEEFIERINNLSRHKAIAMELLER